MMCDSECMLASITGGDAPHQVPDHVHESRGELVSETADKAKHSREDLYLPTLDQGRLTSVYSVASLLPLRSPVI